MFKLTRLRNDSGGSVLDVLPVIKVLQLHFPTTAEQGIALVCVGCNKSMHSNFARHLCEILSYL